MSTTSSGARGRPTGPARERTRRDVPVPDTPVAAGRERVRTHPLECCPEAPSRSQWMCRVRRPGRCATWRRAGSPMGDHTSRRPARGPSRSRLGPQVLTPPVGMPAVPDEVQATPSPSAPEPVREPAVTSPPAGSATGRSLCLCGHPKQAHDHYRAGTDCGICGASTCASYRVQGGFLRRLLRRAGLVGRSRHVPPPPPPLSVDGLVAARSPHDHRHLGTAFLAQ